MKIINCQTLGELCEYMLDGEPVFLIRSQDISALEAVSEYIRISSINGGKNIIRAHDQLSKIKEWRDSNPKKVRVAD